MVDSFKTSTDLLKDIIQIDLDRILVYADLMSEPVSHFLAFSRLAPVQAEIQSLLVNMRSTISFRGKGRRPLHGASRVAPGSSDLVRQAPNSR